jgi:hypothetical protein
MLDPHTMFWQRGAVPVSWELRESLLVIRLSGAYRFAEGQRAVDEALARPEFRRGTALLMDARESLANPPADEIRTRAEWLATLPERGFLPRMAVVTGPELFRYGLTRMLSSIAENRGVVIATFESLEAAEDWLVGSKQGSPPSDASNDPLV